MLYVLMLIMAPFAVYKIATMVALEEGPLSIFEKFRNLFLTPNWVGRGVRCPSCISFWAGLVMAEMIWYFGQSGSVQMGIIGLGLSGAATYLAVRKF
jgi:hypothetical protein